MLGRALGRSEQASELTEEVRDTFADVAAAHPQWKGLEVAVATFEPDLLTAFPSTDPRGKFFTNLGFAIPAEYDRLAGEDFYVEISRENAAQLDKDLLVWDGLSYIDDGREQLEKDPLLSRLKAMTEGRVVFMDETLENAFAFSSVLSLKYVVEHIVPLIEAALADAEASAEPTA